MTAIAIFPSMLTGWSVGWLNGDRTYCFVWGNFKDKETATKVLKESYPDSEIVEYTKDNPPNHRNKETMKKLFQPNIEEE